MKLHDRVIPSIYKLLLCFYLSSRTGLETVALDLMHLHLSVDTGSFFPRQPTLVRDGLALLQAAGRVGDLRQTDPKGGGNTSRSSPFEFGFHPPQAVWSRAS